jgi:hypothetical protein
MANINNIKTVQIGVGQTYDTSPGCRGIDFLYYGTTDAVTLTGSAVGSQPVPLPPSVPYSLEYNERGYGVVTVTNNGDAIVYVVEKF